MTVPEYKSPQAKVRLVPWDPENQAHVERMYHQRVACTWKEEMIGKWREGQRTGFMSLQWIVIDDSDPEKLRKEAEHVKKYPNEAEPLEDTATSINGQPRSPPAHAVPFIPVGHISLDRGNLTDPSVDNIEEDIFWITSLYVSRAIQNGGLGRAAFHAIEASAAKEPWNAKWVGLDTVYRDWLDTLDPKYSFEKPKIVNQTWYENMGYEVFKMKEDGYEWVVDQKTKETLFIPLVFMKKKI